MGHATPPPQGPQSTALVSFRILSWNLHATPFSRANSTRVQRAAVAISQQRPDVALLQELWRHDDVRRLRAELGSSYEVCEVQPAGRIYRRSGLLTVVRKESAWLVEQSTFHEFRSEAGDWRFWEGDGLGDKGVQTVLLKRGESRLGLLNTHLQSSYSRGEYAVIRARQIAEFNNVAASLPATIPVIAGGDFNTMPGEAVFERIRDSWVDLTETFRRGCHCGTHYLPDGKEGGWIDHLLARTDRAWHVTVEDVSLLRNVSVDNPYSDHHGLIGTVNVRPAFPPAEAVATLLVGSRRFTRRQWLHTCAQPWLSRAPGAAPSPWTALHIRPTTWHPTAGAS